MDSLKDAIQDHSRKYERNRYVYPVISRRAGGISIGVNLNINKKCNFGCIYCQVDRTSSEEQPDFDISILNEELSLILKEYRSGALAKYGPFKNIAPEKKVLKDICISGDGEATTRPEFLAVCQLLSDIQNENSELDLKLVLITNATMLNRESVREGLQKLTHTNGEVWAKLDAGTQEWFDEIDRSSFNLESIIQMIAETARTTVVQIQTMICAVYGRSFSTAETTAYIENLQRIVEAGGSNVRAVQLYSVARQTTESFCTGVDASVLESIKERVLQTLPDLPVHIY